MKKLLILLIPIFAFAQEIKYKDEVFSKVFQTEKSNEEVYQSAKEWIAINFKSANNVLQLDTKEKLIVKGTDKFTLPSLYGSYYDYYGDIMLTISIRDKRFKIDYELTQFQSVEFPDNKFKLKEARFALYASFATEKELLDWRLKTFDEAAKKEKMKERKYIKLKKQLVSNNSENFKTYKNQFKDFTDRVESTIDSMANYINKEATGDDW
jgi:hypothetical protein